MGLQAVELYLLLAVGYNLCSLLLQDWRGRTLAPTEPVSAINMMVLLYLVHATQHLLGLIPWSLLITLYTLLIARFGIWRHLVGYSKESYHSRTAWTVAIVINLLGVLTLVQLLITAFIGYLSSGM